MDNSAIGVVPGGASANELSSQTGERRLRSRRRLTSRFGAPRRLRSADPSPRPLTAACEVHGGGASIVLTARYHSRVITFEPSWQHLDLHRRAHQQESLMASLDPDSFTLIGRGGDAKAVLLRSSGAAIALKVSSRFLSFTPSCCPEHIKAGDSQQAAANLDQESSEHQGELSVGIGRFSASGLPAEYRGRGSEMLSLLPNERTGDHRDDPSPARPAVRTVPPVERVTRRWRRRAFGANCAMLKNIARRRIRESQSASRRSAVDKAFAKQANPNLSASSREHDFLH
ncbi:hypothetical protein EYF80_038514 [Liparis tanakae]|uniref:Uncharacterized protein n=1 Tax=Liparis tanakae TaxID=230148 RepID=A0A4Z2GCJ9_9TELE|nr:hypothetical protein EYF80_038514 [Liparis tanakae]